MARSVFEAAIVLARDAREDRAVVELGGLEIGPREGVAKPGVGLGIGGAVAQYQELVKARFGLGHKASFGLAGLLVGMLVQLPIGGKRAAGAFIPVVTVALFIPTMPTQIGFPAPRRNCPTCFTRSPMTRSICLIMALARILTSTPISTVATGPCETSNPGSSMGVALGISSPKVPRC